MEPLGNLGLIGSPISTFGRKRTYPQKKNPAEAELFELGRVKSCCEAASEHESKTPDYIGAFRSLHGCQGAFLKTTQISFLLPSSNR